MYPKLAFDRCVRAVELQWAAVYFARGTPQHCSALSNAENVSGSGDTVPCTGFEDLHSFAFIGNSGRIGTASDGLFSYVPAGPNKQIDMFLRAYDLRKEGRLEVRACISVVS